MVKIQCKCGQLMRLELRTIQVAGEIQILHVPMRACEACSTYRLLGSVKPILTDYLKNIETSPRKKRISFTKINESSQVIYEVFLQEESDSCEELELAVREAINERINLLLDLFGYAKGVEDMIWVDHIRQRLRQLSNLLAELDRENHYSHEKG
ncbi:hypothetical protein ACP8HI_13355 [Paenibacillus sp. FA6]|uniref:hypothetical protein n=1 Tax=Paenibacillus sp. FA6 TaxID=3413029 RepID=UPI003F65BB84